MWYVMSECPTQQLYFINECPINIVVGYQLTNATSFSKCKTDR